MGGGWLRCVRASTTATPNSAVGTYPITGQAVGDRYEITFVDGTYTVALGTKEVTSRDGLAAAIADVNVGTVKMTAYFAVSETVVIPAGRTITFDLNGCTVTAGYKNESIGHYAVDNYGIWTVEDSSSGGRGMIKAGGVENFATMYLRGGTLEAIDDGGGAAVWNEKKSDSADVKFSMTGGTLKTSGVNAGYDAAYVIVVNENTAAEILGGNLDCVLTSIVSQGELTVENVTLSLSAKYETYGWWNCVKVNAGTATFRNVTVNTAAGGRLEAAGGTAKLYDCTFTQRLYDTYCSMNVAASGAGSVEVHGGEFTSDGYCAYVFSSGGRITINGGTFNAEKDALIADRSTSAADSIINVNGGDFTGSIAIVAENAECVIKAGTFHGVEEKNNGFIEYADKDSTGVYNAETKTYTVTPTAL